MSQHDNASTAVKKLSQTPGYTQPQSPPTSAIVPQVAEAGLVDGTPPIPSPEVGGAAVKTVREAQPFTPGGTESNPKQVSQGGNPLAGLVSALSGLFSAAGGAIVSDGQQDLARVPEQAIPSQSSTGAYQSSLPGSGEYPTRQVATPSEASSVPQPEGYQTTLVPAVAPGADTIPAVEAEGILNLIGRAEGGQDAVSGYEESFGDGAFTGKTTFTDKTLNQIDSIQTGMLADPANTLNSSALGKFQIVRTTLRSLRDELGLTGEEKFSPELQDKLAVTLLERRGLSQWQEGKISDNEFVDNLSKEWASLPTSQGQSYYGQRTATTPEAVLEALSLSRTPEQQTQPAEPTSAEQPAWEALGREIFSPGNARMSLMDAIKKWAPGRDPYVFAEEVFGDAIRKSGNQVSSLTLNFGKLRDIPAADRGLATQMFCNAIQ